jgi:hypothetical protein
MTATSSPETGKLLCGSIFTGNIILKRKTIIKDFMMGPLILVELKSKD